MSDSDLKPGAVRPRIERVRSLLAQDLLVPDYQRPYRWSVRNVAQLIDDVRAFQGSGRYRLGTVILHRSGDTLEIVDGQQRFITLALLAYRLHADGLAPATGGHTLSPNGIEISAEHIRENYAYIEQTLAAIDDREEFAEFLLDSCDVVVLELSSADEAFQMFDSQNSRGRALYPTDLLKAFHIREMSSDLVSDRDLMRMVQSWEDIPAAAINSLFSDYLFKIKRWANARSVPDVGFAAADIDLFKGIRESNPANAHNAWAMPFLYAKNYVDDYSEENATLIRYGALVSASYPFQIDQPVINGETFFQMVGHYYRLALAHRVLSKGNIEPDDQDLAYDFEPFRKDKRFDYVRNLYSCLMLYYVDRFGDQHLSAARRLMAQYCAALRIGLSQVRRRSIDLYALGLSGGEEMVRINLFQELREAQSASEFLRRTIPRPRSFERFPELERFFVSPEGASR